MAKFLDVKFTVSSRRYLRTLARQQKQIEQLPQRAYKYFVAQTPVDSGNARRSTTLQGNEIHADYPYAERLDEGWSKQAPRGMVKPTTKWVTDQFKKIFRK